MFGQWASAAASAQLAMSNISATSAFFVGATLPEPGSPWLAGLYLVLALLGGHLVASLLLFVLKRWAGRTDTHIDDAIVDLMPAPLRALGTLVGGRLVLPLVGLPASASAPVAHALLVGMILAGGWVLVKGVRVFEAAANRRVEGGESDDLHARAVRTQVRGVRNIADFVVFIVALGFALTTFESVRQIGNGVLASAGLAGVVLGFAAQKTLATLLAGIQLTVTQRIRVDDIVVVEGQWGSIEEIRLTYVVVRIWDKRRLILPASYFIEKPFENWTRSSTDLLGTVHLWLDYSVPVDEVRAELKRILDASEHWDGEAWGVVVTDANEHAMLVRPLASAKDASAHWNLRCEIREKLIGFVQRNYPDALPRTRATLGQSPAAAESAR
jgi:small-conductance mechanosensitive channel